MSVERSTPSLLGDVVEQTITLFQTELRLLSTELHEKVNRALGGFWLMIGGVSLIVAAIFLLLAALVDFLAASGLPRYQAGVIVGVCVAVIGAALVAIARGSLDPKRLQPRRSIEQVRKDISVAKAQVKG